MLAKEEDESDYCVLQNGSIETFGLKVECSDEGTLN